MTNNKYVKAKKAKSAGIAGAQKLAEETVNQMMQGFAKASAQHGKAPKVYEKDTGMVYPSADDAALGDY